MQIYVGVRTPRPTEISMLKDGYKDTEIGVIPVEWDVVKLQDYIKLTSGKFNPKKNLQDEKNDSFTYPVYGGNGITGFFTDYLVSNPTIIIGRVGEYCGSVHLEKTSIWITDNAIYTKEISPEFNIDFLYETFGFIGLENLAERTGQPKITQEPIYNLKIPFPPLKEQEKIADILSTTDDKIDAIALQIQKAETLKKGLLQKLLSEGIGHSKFKDSELGRIPEGWEVVKLGEVSKIKDGTHFSPKSKTGPSKYVTSKNIKFGYFDETTITYISQEEHNEIYKRCPVRKGQILLTKDGAKTGNACLNPLDEPFSLLSSVAVIDGKQNFLDNRYLLQWFLSSLGQKSLKGSMSGQAITRLTLTKISAHKIILPPLSEQKQIANILSSADKKLDVLKIKNNKYFILKKGLMQKLLTGEVRV